MIYVCASCKMKMQSDKIFGLKEEQEKLTNTTTTLAKLNTLKGQIGNKVSTITKEHKFFSENVTCPTCTQSIEESFRLNRISHAQTKAKELNPVTKNWKKQ